MSLTIAQIKSYYKNPDIANAIISFAKDREIGVMFDGYFGKRPDVIENTQDYNSLVEKGVRSFHMSEEIWLNPLLLNSSNSDADKEQNRLGWDLILDLDGVDYRFSQIVGDLIIKFLNGLGVKNVSTKFSGNKGFHIGIPFNAFSPSIIGMGETRKLFPIAAKKIAAFIVYELKGKISKAIFEECGSIEDISKKYGISISDLINDDKDSMNLNFMKLIEIDTILITSRHLFRMPYSLNEKSGLVSVPVKNSIIIDFKREWASPSRIKPLYHKNYQFLKYDPDLGHDADILLMKAYEDDRLEQVANSIESFINSASNAEFNFEITENIEVKDFPKAIQFALNNNFEDGKKRALFMLMTFLYSINWDSSHIEKTILDWNDRQSSPLKFNYINAQINWFESNKDKKLSTPLYDNDNYYQGIGIPEKVILEDKNAYKGNLKSPMHYIYVMLSNKRKNVKKN